MRTIKFRGKSLETDDWVYGFLADGNLICTWDNRRNAHEVLSITVGQFTGLTDKNGKEIYEGDIVQSESGEFVYQVVFNETRFASFGLKRKQDLFLHYFGEAIEADKCEVIGNVYDNPELLKGGEQ